MKNIILILIFLLLAAPVFADEEGFDYDYKEGSPVEFDDLKKDDADFFDFGDGREHDASLERIDKDMGEVEVYDYDENRYRTIDTD